MSDADVDYRCPVCLGPLLVDRSSIQHLMRSGLRGARVHCSSGCTDVWLKDRDAVLTPLPQVPPADGRGKYRRPLRKFVCQMCGLPSTTRGRNTARCLACAKKRQRERDLRRHDARVAARNGHVKLGAGAGGFKPPAG